MSRTIPHHHTLTDGVGKCSAPQWYGWGGDAGFCGEPAFGERPPSKEYPGPYWDPGDVRREDGRYAGYIPGLACPRHGGPTPEEFAVPGGSVYLDGDAWCSIGPGFVNIQESPCGFGPSPAAATAALLAERAS